MKSSELQTGDFVRLKRTNEVVGVFEIDGDRNVINNEPDGYCSEKNIAVDDVEPITLTLEILERNGFELRNGFLYHRIDDKPHHYDFKLENGGVFTSEGYTLQCCIYHLTIRYVHELQHALRLCRLNDLADNFKTEER